MDDDPCTSGETCGAGVCAGGSGACACVVDADCDAFDPDRCDGGLRCAAGACAPGGAAAVVCPPSDNPCQPLVCAPASGECVTGAAPDGASCGQAGTCTDGAVCQAGTCTPPAGACDDGNPCTTDVCDLLKGCLHVATAGPCDDGDDCTAGDHCVGASCEGTAIACACSGDGDCVGAAFDPCKGRWECASGKCSVRAGTAVVCAPAGPCATVACEPATGKCAQSPAPDGSACDDGTPCTVAEVCGGGVCGGGSPVVCDDKNPCTNDACQPGVGCVFTPNSAPCDDGNACTQGEACQAGVCSAGSALACPGDGACLVGTCNAATGCALKAAPAATACDDGNACTTGDHCEAGACVGENACACTGDADCKDDGNLCNGVPRCVDGACVIGPATVVACPPGGDCATVSCDAATGLCVSVPAAGGKACFDAGPCKAQGVCAAGACVAPDVDCDDGNPCTVDACVAQTGVCAHTPVNGSVCNDGEPCTTADRCVLGACVGGQALVCDDGNACTVDTCVPGKGCEFTAIAAGGCSDDDPCTADSCDPASGCVHAPKSCDGGVAGPCESAVCDPATAGCVVVAKPEGSACSDGDPCTASDRCKAGHCVGVEVVCDDADACTADGCVGGTCVFKATAGAPCDDGDPCTVGDACAAQGCVGAAVDCDDGNPCTTDACVAGTCEHTKIALCGVGVACAGPAGSSCDDGNKQTVADVCISGVCLGFTRTTVSGLVGTNTAVRGVDYAAGRWFVIVDNGFPFVGGGGLGELSAAGASKTFSETQSGSTFQALRGGFATDSTGKLWRFEPATGSGTWTSNGPASKAFAALGTMTGTALWTSADIGSGLDIALWSAGNTSSARIRRCGAAGGGSVTCVAENNDTLQGTLLRAFAGGPCAAIPCANPDLSLAADYPNGTADYYNDVYGRTPAPNLLWTLFYTEQGDGPSVTRDATALADGRQVAVGTRGYLRARSAQGKWGGRISVKSSDSRNFEGAWSGAGVVALAAWRSGNNQSRVFELWLGRTSGELTSGGAWNLLELGTESGTGSVLHDVWGTAAGSLRVVGTRAANFGLTEGVVYSRIVD